MNIRIFIVVFLLHALMLVGAAHTDDSGKLRENQKELEKIHKQLDETKQKVDSLKQLESNLRKTIGNYGDRVNRNRKLVGKLENQLAGVRKELSSSKSQLEENQTMLDLKRDSYRNLIVEYYRERQSQKNFNALEFETQFDRARQFHYLAAVSGHSSRELTLAEDAVRDLTRQSDSLEQKGGDLSRLRREKESKIKLDLTLKEQEESSLGTVRRQTTLLQDRLVSLSEYARQMEDIIAELEEAQQRKRDTGGPQVRFRTGSFTQNKGNLTPPIKGKIVSTFGWKTNSATKLKSFSPGIDIKPSTGYKNVVACGPGRVVYVGVLRGYDNFVILEHDDGYYTTYAGLSKVSVEMDDVVDSGKPLGVCTSGTMHFEIRQGREHLDPVIWLSLDGF